MAHGIGERIKRAREAAKLSQADLAQKVGITQQTLQKLESDPSRGTKHINRFARALGQDAAWLEENVGEMRAPPEGAVTAREIESYDAADAPTDPTVERRTVPIVAAVQTNVWRKPIEWPTRDRYEIPLPIPAVYNGFSVTGFAVRGPSMDRFYPHGSLLVAVAYMDLGRDPRSGERVIAKLSRGGQEALIAREYRIDRDGKARLWPHSSHPDFQQPLLVDDRDVAVAVTHLIIAVYRLEL